MIKLQNVSKYYLDRGKSVHALEHINLHVKPGEIFGVIGKSGAGKSTLIRCVNLLERPSKGKVIVDNQELTALNGTALRKARHNIGMIFQHFNLISTRNVFDNIAFPLQLQGIDKKTLTNRVNELLALVNLADKSHAYPSQLSGGQKQRVAIARALASKPKVLLCDEMTSALDPETTVTILALIKKINIEMQLSILLITHEMDVIKTIADRVAVIDQGRIIECADVVELFRHPQTAVSQSFTQQSLHGQLPGILQKKLHQNSQNPADRIVLRITFLGDAATEPKIDELIRHSELHINILQANLDYLCHETIGTMIVSANNDATHIEKALIYLHENGLNVEVLGYARFDD